MVSMRSRPVRWVFLRYSSRQPTACAVKGYAETPEESSRSGENCALSSCSAPAVSSCGRHSSAALSFSLINLPRPVICRVWGLMRISRGEKRASSFLTWDSSSCRESAESSVARSSPVEISAKQTPAARSPANTEQIKLFLDSSSMLLSITVPGVITRMTARLTSPLAKAGSSICSQIATL